MAAFVIVCGPPASGKTGLATHLGSELGLPVISKDVLKEHLMDHLGGGPDVGEAAFAVQFAIARELHGAGTPFILEGAFFGDQPELAELMGAEEAIVVELTCALDVLEGRYAERHGAGARHAGHRGLEALPDLRRRVTAGEYGVPALGRATLRVDTTREMEPSQSEVVEWVRAKLKSRSLRRAWDEESEAWTRWVRKPGHDSYWRFGREALFAMLPPPGRLTIDLGCGEGRVSRDLAAAGHRVVGLDGSPGLARAALDAAPAIPVMVGDAARIPLVGAAADLVVAYMTVHDFDDMPGALREAARVLTAGGVLCMGIVHPINSAGNFQSTDDDAAFVIEDSYFQSRSYVDRIKRDGLTMTFSSLHHPLEEYFEALSKAGFTVESLREVSSADARWERVPMFLFIRAVKR